MDRKGLQIGRTALCLPILLSQQMLVGLPVEELCGAAVRIRIRAVGGGRDIYRTCSSVSLPPKFLVWGGLYVCAAVCGVFFACALC